MFKPGQLRSWVAYAVEWTATYLLDHLINLLLPHEEDCGSKNALEEFISDAFVDSTNPLVLYYREHTIQCGLVLGVTGLEPALYNAKKTR